MVDDELVPWPVMSWDATGHSRFRREDCSSGDIDVRIDAQPLLTARFVNDLDVPAVDEENICDRARILPSGAAAVFACDDPSKDIALLAGRAAIHVDTDAPGGAGLVLVPVAHHHDR